MVSKLREWGEVAARVTGTSIDVHHTRVEVYGEPQMEEDIVVPERQNSHKKETRIVTTERRRRERETKRSKRKKDIPRKDQEFDRSRRSISNENNDAEYPPAQIPKIEIRASVSDSTQENMIDKPPQTKVVTEKELLPDSSDGGFDERKYEISKKLKSEGFDSERVAFFIEKAIEPLLKFEPIDTVEEKIKRVIANFRNDPQTTKGTDKTLKKTEVQKESSVKEKKKVGKKLTKHQQEVYSLTEKQTRRKIEEMEQEQLYEADKTEMEDEAFIAGRIPVQNKYMITKGTDKGKFEYRESFQDRNKKSMNETFKTISEAGKTKVGEDMEMSVDIEELLTFAQKIPNKVNDYREQLGYGDGFVETSPRHKALLAVFQMKMGGGKITKLLEKMKVGDDSVRDNKISIDTLVRHISEQEDIVKSVLVLSETERDVPEPTVEFHLEGRKEELSVFEKSLEEFLIKYPASADEPGMKVLRDSLEKAKVLVEGTDNSSTLWKMASELDSLNEQLTFLDKVYSAPEKISDTRQILQERMQEPFTENEEELTRMSRELFDLLGENETNLEEYGFHSPQVQETNDKYIEVLNQFDVLYQKKRHAFERSQIQKIIDDDMRIVENNYQNLHSRIESDEVLSKDQKKLLSNQLMRARALYITQTGGYSTEPTEAAVHNALLQWNSAAEAITQYAAPGDTSGSPEPMRAFKDRISEVDSVKKIAAIEAGIVGINAEVAKGQVLAEKLPAHDTKRRGWKTKLKGLGSEVLNGLAVAGLLYSVTPADMSEVQAGTSKSPSIASTTNESDPISKDTLGVDGLGVPVVAEQSPKVSETLDPIPSIEMPASIASIHETAPETLETEQGDRIVSPSDSEQSPEVSHAVDSIPMTEVPQMQSESDLTPDVALEKQPIEHIFRKGANVNTVSESVLETWKQNKNVLGENISSRQFLMAMWKVLADLEKNPKLERQLTTDMHIQSGDIDRVAVNETVDLRPLYELIRKAL